MCCATRTTRTWVFRPLGAPRRGGRNRDGTTRFPDSGWPRHLGLAKALVCEMPHTLAALQARLLSEWRATLIVRESACLDVDDRRILGAELCTDASSLEGLGDPQAAVDRAAKAESDRTVTIRPAPDAMTFVIALLPVAQGVSVYAALKRAADTTFDGRSRGQVMADALIERVTGRPAQVAVNSGDVRRVTVGHRHRRPRARSLVAMESRTRCFPAGWAAFIGMRDRCCRTPYCDAPIRHTDHATPHRPGRGDQCDERRRHM